MERELVEGKGLGEMGDGGWRMGFHWNAWLGLNRKAVYISSIIIDGWTAIPNKNPSSMDI